ncbi:MAG: hypothetical protein DCF12_07965 [Snowella sp.]|nr:MAG: hypothetical protein DCF12_07965 [Snowella sp.]
MNIIEILKKDYQRFPRDQTYEIYAKDVYFKDPMTEFRGIKRYQAMIGFMSHWFQNIQMELHHIEQIGDRLETRWTLSWTTPLPWQPHIAISGRSELMLNDQNLIISHIDYWDCSRWDVLQQHFSS